MKYSFTFRVVLFIGITLACFAIVAWQEGLTTLCGVMICLSFIFCYGAIAAPDHEKYSDEYYKKRKG